MKKMKLLTLAAWVSLCLTGLPAKADLLSLDSPTFGANSLTLDTRTGLTWLDMPFTLDLSYLDAETATQPGGQFAGFRHATAQEVLSLYTSAGFGEGFIPEASSSGANIASLLSLVGETYPQSAAGLTGSLNNGTALSAAISYGFFSGTPGYFVTATTGDTAYGLTTSYPTIGNWMVEVPEPSAGALFLLAGALVLRLRGGKR